MSINSQRAKQEGMAQHFQYGDITDLGLKVFELNQQSYIYISYPFLGSKS